MMKYKLKTDEELTKQIKLFGHGTTFFHTADIQRLLLRNIELEKALNDTDEILREVYHHKELPAPFPTRSQLDTNSELIT